MTAMDRKHAAERVIVDVLSALLQREDIGVHENFFDMGADSMLIIEARQRLSAALRRDLSAVDMFTYPNVSALAAFVAGAESETAAADGARRAQQRLDRLAARRQR